MPINWPNLITAIDAEISRLQQARKLLSRTDNGTRPRKRKFKMSAEGRASIIAAQKKRWARQKKAAKG
jgi:hypothetical protein